MSNLIAVGCIAECVYGTAGIGKVICGVEGARGVRNGIQPVEGLERVTGAIERSYYSPLPPRFTSYQFHNMDPPIL